jgi:DNA polymerase-1
MAYLDLSQIEIRVFALAAQELQMLEALSRGADIHTFVAAMINGVEEDDVTKQMRQRAKGVNFGIIYGMGIGGLAQQIQQPYEVARKLWLKYMRLFKAVKEFMARNSRQLRAVGYVEDMFERRYHVPEEAANSAVNAIVQGASATVLKTAMANIDLSLARDRVTADECSILMQIHDELVFEIIDDWEFTRHLLKQFHHEMVTIPPVSDGVSLEASISLVPDGRNWADKREIPLDALDEPSFPTVLAMMEAA